MEDEVHRLSMIQSEHAGVVTLIDKGISQIGMPTESLAPVDSNPEVSFTFKRMHEQSRKTMLAD